MSGKFQDITRLAGLVFLRRSFVKQADKEGLDAIFEKESLYGDLDDEQRAAFKDAFNNPRLREIVATWWSTYDDARSKGEIAPMAVWEP